MHIKFLSAVNWRFIDILTSSYFEVVFVVTLETMRTACSERTKSDI